MSYGALAAELERQYPVKACGYLPRLPDCALESRHLGLVTAQEVSDPKEKMQRLARAAEQTLEELVRRWPVRETPWLLRLRSAAARKSGAEVRSILQEMERTQVYLSAAGRQELAFWKGGAA